MTQRSCSAGASVTSSVGPGRPECPDAKCSFNVVQSHEAAGATRDSSLPDGLPGLRSDPIHDFEFDSFQLAERVSEAPSADPSSV